MSSDINKRILQAIELNKNIKLIEMSKISMKDITVEVLDKLQEKDIDLQMVDSLKPLQMYTYKTDCFAYKDKQCTALVDIDCVNCRFYKNKEKLKQWDIEHAIRNYNK